MTQGAGRQVFFSFDYEEDRNRADAVFQLLRKQDAVPAEAGFAGSSLWQTATGPSNEEVKRLARETIGRTLATCVLVGARTSEREWMVTRSCNASSASDHQARWLTESLGLDRARDQLSGRVIPTLRLDSSWVKPCNGAQRLENWKERRAFAFPYFLRSTTRGSRVRKPPRLRAPRRSGS